MADAAVELAHLRADAERELRSTCNVISVERSKDARGNSIEATVTGADFACNVAPMARAGEGVLDEQSRGVPYRVHYPHDVVLDHRDRLLVDVEGELSELEVVTATDLHTSHPIRTAIAVRVPS